MENLAFTDQLKSWDKSVKIISGAGLRKKFCDKIVEMGIVANHKGVDLDVQFTNKIPDYFFGDERLFNKTISELLQFSIKNTSEGAVKISVSADFCRESNEWWLTIVVDDNSRGIPPELISYIYGIQRNTPVESHGDIRSIEKLKVLRDICLLQGGEMVIVNIAKDTCLHNGYGGGNQIMVNIPYRSISVERLPYPENYMA